MIGIINPCLAYEVNLICFLQFTEEEAKINASVSEKEKKQAGAFASILDGFKGKLFR